MAHTYTNLLSHIIFSTKERIPYLRDNRLEDACAYLGGIARQIRVIPLNIGGHDDHVHILARIPASSPLADVVNKIKTNSSRWIHDKGIFHPAFAWQEGYAAFSVANLRRRMYRRTFRRKRNIISESHFRRNFWNF
jgi:REP element-mobilizing transposase RayT